MADAARLDAPPGPVRRRHWGRIAAFAVVALVVLAVAGAWFARERIAGNVIAAQLKKHGIPARYEIERIGPREQILRNVAIGDPSRPDLTIARAVVRINLRFGMPTLGRVTLIRPRLVGTYRSGVLSFGSLDPLLFRQTERKAFELPDLDLAIEDGRARIESDLGAVSTTITGRGHLQDGFAGQVAANAPRLGFGACEGTGVTVQGRLRIAGRKPHFAGPLGFTRVSCQGAGLAVATGQVQLTLTADEPLRRFDGEGGVRLGNSSVGALSIAGAAGTSAFTWRDEGLTARFQLAGTSVQAPQAALAKVGLQATLRARRKFDRIELDGALDGAGLRPGPALDAALARAVDGAQGTMLAPLIRQVRSQLAHEARANALSARFTWRQTGSQSALVAPEASVRGASGQTLLQVSRFQLARRPGRWPTYSGAFATGGPGLPRIAGRVAVRGPASGVEAWLMMADYAAAGSRLAVPDMTVVQRADGAIGFAGTVRGSGQLPGGRTDNLVLPVTGNRSVRGEWSAWPGCTQLTFDRLQYANLALGRQALTLCPARGAPILRYGAGGLRLAAGVPSLRVSGLLGQTPIAIRSGAVGFAYPGAVSARQLDVALGPAATAQRFLISDLSAKLGGDLAGRFSGADVRLFSVPLDVVGASGGWRYAAGRLSLSEGDFRLIDRQSPARFEPLVARGAALTLENNLIGAQAILREPKGGREITTVDLRHSLLTGRGQARLGVRGVTFGPDLQPLDLTPLVYGIVSNVRGEVRGSGAVEWGPSGVTSNGSFSSEALDFAAAFGPVKGASGTVVFSDLIGLTTAPGQRIRVASVNPGIEVTDGEVSLSLRGGRVLAVESGTWPFLGGTLTLRPVTLTFGKAEERQYVFDVKGLDAARFVQRMELANLSATGIFDGTLPIVFDARGDGHIVGGYLESRPGGGNVAYVGELTYKDLSTMANLAFGALRSLDYNRMTIAMDGDLTGELVARVRFDGVSQGTGAANNIVTRALAGLPLRFNVNVRGPFYQLISSLRAMYDPAAIKDPRDLGLLDAAGNVVRRSATDAPAAQPTPDPSPIQPRESETVR